MYIAKEFFSVDQLNKYMQENTDNVPRQLAYSNDFRNTGAIVVMFEVVSTADAPAKKPLRKS